MCVVVFRCECHCTVKQMKIQKSQFATEIKYREINPMSTQIYCDANPSKCAGEYVWYVFTAVSRGQNWNITVNASATVWTTSGRATPLANMWNANI